MGTYLQTGATLKTVLMRDGDQVGVVGVSRVDLGGTSEGTGFVAAGEAKSRGDSNVRMVRIGLVLGSVELILQSQVEDVAQ